MSNMTSLKNLKFRFLRMFFLPIYLLIFLMNIDKLLKYLDFLVVIKIEKHFYRNNLCKEMLVSYTS